MDIELTQALQKIKDVFGENIFKDIAKFKAAIADCLPGSGREKVLRKRSLEALELGVYTHLYNSKNDINRVILYTVKLLHDNGIDETMAKEIVSAFAVVVTNKPIYVGESLEADANCYSMRNKLTGKEVACLGVFSFRYGKKIPDIIIRQGEWEYFVEHSLCKRHIDNNKIIPIPFREYCQLIGIIGEWIYFVEIGCNSHPNLGIDYETIYRVRTDETGEYEKVDYVFLYFIGEWAYYCEYENSDKHIDSDKHINGKMRLYKIHTNGRDKKMLAKDFIDLKEIDYGTRISNKIPIDIFGE